MKQKTLSILVLAFTAALVVACGSPKTPAPAEKPRPASAAAAAIGVIPAPRDITAGKGEMRIDGGVDVLFTGGEPARQTAQYFVDLMNRQRDTGLASPKEGAARAGAVNFVLDAAKQDLGAEGYSLVAAPDRVTITAATPAGLFYGGVTLWQMATAKQQQGIGVNVPAATVVDAPRFPWRGLMLDSVRHFQSVEYVKQFIDWMALHKMNTLHWHLTDDQGWRIQIKKYPKLTSVGAWRVPAGAAPAADIDPKTGKPRVIGGFYTQDQVRDVVAYAAARHVTIVPEIEMPGHASAAVVAYPELGVSGAKLPRAVPSDWGIYDTLFNADESTFKFFENVLTEVIDLFPGQYIHVGGDEAKKDEWQASAQVQARMKALKFDDGRPVKDEHELQSYFIQRMEKFISGKGRKLIGWDEILEGGLAPNATVMSWRGIDGAIAAAKAGHDTVLSPAPDLYFDHWQSAGDLAPGRSNTLSLEMVYKFQPVPDAIPEEQRKHILGLQANLWAEFMRTEDRVTYMAYPRVAALAEIAWSAPARIDWNDFQKRLEMQLPRYDQLGIHYARETPTNPGARRRVSHDLAQCGEGYLLSLEDDAPIEGERAVFLVNISNPCWIWKGVDLSQVGAVRATVGQIPFNFQIGKDADGIPLPKPATPEGELEVRLDKCDGPPLATTSLEPATKNQGLTQLPPIALQGEGKHDICLLFTRSKVDPIWVIGNLELTAR
ncbi:MAG TPA: family 20 glycosylhydrolase [Steroidobacteraceae bacterium]|nr:family 20 glycosylhydrolase [Steroidobacteraceae bacterium]